MTTEDAIWLRGYRAGTQDGWRNCKIMAARAQTITYDLLEDRIVIVHEDGRIERLSPYEVRQKALWKDGRHRVEDVLGVREMPVTR